MKDKLKIWNKEIFGDVWQKKRVLFYERLLRSINDFAMERQSKHARVWNLPLEEVILREKQRQFQKMTVKWARKRDARSRIFFKVKNGKRMKNIIKEIESDGEVFQILQNIGSEDRKLRI